MILLLLALSVGGLIAAKIIPILAVQQERESESLLRANLSQMRQAFDLMARTKPGWDPGLSAPNAIASLVQAGMYREPQPWDPTFPRYLWNQGSNTWILAGNIATRASFEATDNDPSSNFVASWSRGTPETVAATDSTFFPSRDSSQYDDYPGQNRLGEVLGTIGASLRIDR